MTQARENWARSTELNMSARLLRLSAYSRARANSWGLAVAVRLASTTPRLTSSQYCRFQANSRESTMPATQQRRISCLRSPPLSERWPSHWLMRMPITALTV